MHQSHQGQPKCVQYSDECCNDECIIWDSGLFPFCPKLTLTLRAWSHPVSKLQRRELPVRLRGSHMQHKQYTSFRVRIATKSIKNSFIPAMLMRWMRKSSWLVNHECPHVADMVQWMRNCCGEVWKANAANVCVCEEHLYALGHRSLHIHNHTI